MTQIICLNGKKTELLRAMFAKHDTCSCGFVGIHEQPISAYKSQYGWDVNGTIYWLYIECPKCHYGWSLQKLGANQEIF